MKSLSRTVKTRIGALLLSVFSTILSASALSKTSYLSQSLQWSTDEINVVSTWECTSATTMKERHFFWVDVFSKYGDPNHKGIDFSMLHIGEPLTPKSTDPYSVSILTKNLHLGDEDKTPMRSGRVIEFERPYGPIYGVAYREVTLDPTTGKTVLGGWEIKTGWSDLIHSLEALDCTKHVWQPT